MSRGHRVAWVGIGLLGLLLLSEPAHAVEYRLLVASVFDTSLTSFVPTDELTYGASGPGLQRLETAISTGGIEWGDMPAGRPLTGVADSVARAWSGVGIHADILRGGVDAGRWDEVRWEGKPGERSIWLVRVTGNNRPQSVQRVTLESGARPVRLYEPYVFTGGSGRVAVMEIPEPLLAFSETKGNVWDKWVGKGLDLGQGIGAVIGLSGNPLNADLVYLVVQQGDQPTSYRAVISWADPDIDREGRNNRMRHFHHR